MNSLTTADASARPKPRLIRASKLKDLPRPQYLIEDVIAETGVGQLYGPTYVGKTFVAISLALSVANGLDDWFGFRVVHSGPAVYVLMEGLFDFWPRIEAWLAAHSDTSAENLWILPEEPFDLSKPESLEIFEGDMEGVKIEPRLVIVDTQALACPGVEENSNTDMGVVFANLKQFAAKHNCFVLTIHHTGYEGSHARGASAQRAALDTEIRVAAGGTLQVTKVKSYRPSRAVPFQLVDSGHSVWAKPSDDPADAMLVSLADAGEGGLTVAELTVGTFGDEAECHRKKVDRQLKAWQEQDKVQKTGARPARWAVKKAA